MIITIINFKGERRRADLDRVCGYNLPPDHILLEKDDGSLRLFTLAEARTAFEPNFVEIQRPTKIKSINLVQEEIADDEPDPN